MNRIGTTLRELRLTPMLLFVLSLVGRPSAAQSGTFDLERTKAVLTELIERNMKERGVPSISIALVRGDAIVWTAAFGYANVHTRTPATPETLYNTGSTLKAVTSAAVMHLVDRGYLGLDQPANALLGEDRIQDRLQSEKPVTPRHLLSHWSGLSQGFEKKPIWSRESPQPLRDIASGLYSIRAPETKWEYNNYGYALAGLLVEKISGVAYEQYLVENILRPLGVETPHPVSPSPDMAERLAFPYNPGGSAGHPIPLAPALYDYYPAGDAYLTAEDMARFLGAMLNGGVFNGNRILSEESVVAMRTPQFGGSYAFGLEVEKDATGHTIIRHAGRAQGYHAYLMGDVDARVGVYYMANSGDPYHIAPAAIALLRGEAYTPPAEKKPIAVDPGVLRTYVGTYWSTFPQNPAVGAPLPRTVTLEGGRLFIQGMRIEGFGWDKDELLAETPTTFFIRGSEYGVRFVADETGAVTQMVHLRRGNGSGTFKKTS
jgi:CubicO group peptidase (beta-lactamase class C family)